MLIKLVANAVNTPIYNTLGLVGLIFFGFFAFFMTSFLRKWQDAPILIAIAIGCACNTNFFSCFTHPIEFGPITFGLDSILYALFIYTIIVRAFDHSIKDARTLTFTSIAAILIAALIELVACLLNNGTTGNQSDVPLMTQTLTIILKFFGYAASSLGTLIGVFIMIIYIKSAKRVNKYINIVISLIIVNIINSIIFFGYYGLAGLIVPDFALTWDIFLKTLYGSLIIKSYACLLSVLAYLMNQTFWKPRSK